MHEQDAEARSRWRATLMERAQRGDAAAYRVLLDDVGPMVDRFLRHRLRDRADVEDAYQDTFLAMHRARHTYDPARRLEPWLMAIARHVVVDQARRRLAKAAREFPAEVAPELATDGDGAVRIELVRALGRLSRAQRQALHLLVIEGLTPRAAAARAATTPGALKVRAHRASRALRMLLRG